MEKAMTRTGQNEAPGTSPGLRDPGGAAWPGLQAAAVLAGPRASLLFHGGPDCTAAGLLRMNKLAPARIATNGRGMTGKAVRA